MISYLKGKITHKTPTTIILDVNNVGFELQVSVNCSRQLGDPGETITIVTYLHVREDILQLFGFISPEERNIFMNLISTSGIGPKKALAILSGSLAEDVQRYIVQEDLPALMSLSGIGKRTAQRLILELKEKLKPAAEVQDISTGLAVSSKRTVTEEAILALISLGYTPASAQTAIKSIIEKGGENIGLEELITRALRKI